MLKTALLFSCLAVVPLAGCGHARATAARGDGNVTTTARDAHGFDRVEIRAPIDAQITEGKDYSVALSVDADLQDKIVTRVEGDTFVVDVRDHDDEGCHTSGRSLVRISLPELRGVTVVGSSDAVAVGAGDHHAVDLSLRGSGDIHYSGHADRVRAEITGSGDLYVAGAAGELDAEISGSGDIDARGLVARRGRFSVLGSGDITAHVDGGDAAVSIRGSGDVHLMGNARLADVDVAGSGSVDRVADKAPAEPAEPRSQGDEDDSDDDND